MRFADMLVAEHDHIWILLDKLDDAVQDLIQGNPVSSEFLSQALDFIVLYADRCHHGKEEDILFPVIAQKGIPVEGGPIGAMLEEHVQGRALVSRLREAVDRYSSGDSQAGAEIASVAKAYTELLRQHILKENDVLFPMAEEMLTNQEDLELVQRFEEVDLKDIGPQKGRLEEWVRSL